MEAMLVSKKRALLVRGPATCMQYWSLKARPYWGGPRPDGRKIAVSKPDIIGAGRGWIYAIMVSQIPAIFRRGSARWRQYWSLNGLHWHGARPN